MKTMLLAVLIFLLLLTPTFINVPEVSATTTEDLRVAYALPEDVPCEPMPENYTTEDYLNTTNPYSQVNPLGEESEEEGGNPLYVLVFGDEEEREIIRTYNGFHTWDSWAKLQIERGDEALVANFGIDIRILGFEEWDSDDSKDNMYDLWYELEEDTEQYLRTWYDGEWWSGYVDAVIGITSQVDPDPVPGLSPGPEYLDQGRIFTLLNWRIYWADDNLVQHEVSHLFYADDHTPTCCVMAGHTHYQTFIWENGLWPVFNDVPCAYTSYSWCTSCSQTIQQNSGTYLPYTLTISVNYGGTTDPTSGIYNYDYGSSVTVTATANLGYTFDYWWLDNEIVVDNPIIITMDSDHTLVASFGPKPVCAMKTKTDGYFYVPILASNLLRIEMLFDNSDIVGDQKGGTSPYAIQAYPDGIVDLRDTFFISLYYGTTEGDADWDYMTDIVPDGVCDLQDYFTVCLNYGAFGTYSTDLSGVTVTFDTGQVKSPYLSLVSIPEGATNFTVKRYGNPIGAMVIFW